MTYARLRPDQISICKERRLGPRHVALVEVGLRRKNLACRKVAKMSLFLFKIHICPGKKKILFFSAMHQANVFHNSLSLFRLLDVAYQAS